MSESQPDKPILPSDGASAEVAEARDRFKSAAEFEEPQRRSTLAAKKFLVGDQWDEAIKLQRQGAIAIQGQPAAPPRPCFVLDCVSEPHQQIVNAISGSDFAVKISPNDTDANDQTAKVFQGLIRQIQNDGRIEDAMTWAGSDAAGAGIGWALVYPEPCDDYATTRDNDLCIRRIPNSLSVYGDPASTKRDKSDMRYAFITQDMPKSEVKRQWPKADLKGLEDFRATGDDDDKEWVTDSTIRIATYFHVEHVGGKVKVYCDTINAVERLEREEWGGTTIPLIFVSGREMNVDGNVVYHGCVQPAMGPQTMVNFAFSGAAEAMALEPKTPFIVAEGQLGDNYDQIWANANRYNYAYLPYKPTDLNGNLVGPPTRPSSSQNIAAWANVLQMSLDAVRRVTSFDPALGQMPGRQMSADAIEMLQNQGQKGNSGYLDSMRRAYLRLGHILLEAIPVYYDRPGRVVKILGLEDKADVAMLNTPHTMGPNGPQMAMSQPMGQAVAGDILHYDLSKGRYSCTVEVGKSFATKREEGVSALGELSKAIGPEQTAKFVDLWVKEMDFPGSEAVAQRLAPPGEVMQGLPPQAQQLVQSMQQRIQQLEGALQTKTAEIQAKGQIDLQKAQIDNQTKLQIADMTSGRAAQASIIGAELKAGDSDAARRVEVLEIMLNVAKEERLASQKAHELGAEHAAASAQEASKQSHEILGQALDHAHEHAMADKAHQQALEQGAQAAQSQQDLAVTNASLAPEPSSNA